ncbi:uncharacterized protein LOC120691825 isoform X1 [Panicum virgatum]|uniref:uncharacterized protein LOC120691825 isoform X1 n=1 Tax=Panicum virgatum TaxID=38727 RepID=UPI0019D57C45|nr:uncharacterized protein LOC120691825 isoform X1 [Panicum virgatum]
MTKKSGYGRATRDAHHDQSKDQGDHSVNSFRFQKITGEANQQKKHGQSNSSSGHQAPAAAKRKTWKKYLTFLSMFHNKMKHKKSDTKAPTGFKQRRNSKRSPCPVLQECSNLVRVIQRTAADCFAAAASGAGDEDELRCYMQLDQVSYGVKRETFGPIYLVT